MMTFHLLALTGGGPLVELMLQFFVGRLRFLRHGSEHCSANYFDGVVLELSPRCKPELWDLSTIHVLQFCSSWPQAR